jgi:Ca2+-binding RTX toxin-like protein
MACAPPEPESGAAHEPGEYEGVEEASDPLTDLTAQCTFTPGAGLLELTLHGGDVALIARAASGNVLINGFSCPGATVSAVKEIEVSEGNPGDETLIIDYSGGLFAIGSPLANGITVDLGSQDIADALKILGTSGNDSYVVGAGGLAVNIDLFPDLTFTGVEQFVVSLSEGSDTFSGAGNTATGAAFAQAIELFGGGGNDSLRGGGAADVYFGGEGTDLFPAGPAADGADVLNGGNGIDTADYSGRGAVTLSIDGAANDGGDGGAEGDDVAADIEVLRAGSGADALTGGEGSQTLHGGGGNDTLSGGPGADVMNGDAGDDVFDEGSETSGADVMNGGIGIDTADYSSRTILVRVNLNSIADDGQSGEADRVPIDVENVTGGAGNDVLTGSSLANLLAGGDGDDSLAGVDGDDLLRGGAGNDSLSGGNGQDTLDAEAEAAGDDIMLGGAGVDLVTYQGRSTGVIVVMDGVTAGGESGEVDKVGADIENLRGGPGDDQLTGNVLDNVLEGGDGSDALNGGAGDDVIDGDAGSDAIDCGAGDADVLLDGTTSSIDGCEL